MSGTLDDLTWNDPMAKTIASQVLEQGCSTQKHDNHGAGIFFLADVRKNRLIVQNSLQSELLICEKII